MPYTPELSTSKSSEKQGFFKRYGRGIGACAAALAGVSVVAAYGIVQTNSDNEAARTVREAQKLTKQDGFESDLSGTWTADSHGYGSIKINENCSLDNVSMDIKQKDGHVVDVTAYHIDGKAYPHIENEYNAASHHYQQTVEGADVQLTFTNKEDLEKNILHATDINACKALADALAFQQKYPQ
jgi:hypothetical protein